jgi:hypothetical protein
MLYRIKVVVALLAVCAAIVNCGSESDYGVDVSYPIHWGIDKNSYQVKIFVFHFCQSNNTFMVGQALSKSN